MRYRALLLAGLCAAAFPGVACRAQLTVSNQTYSANDTISLLGPTTITTSGTVTVPAGSSVTYQVSGTGTGSYISLQPGFTASAGSLFQAVAVSSQGSVAGSSQIGATSGSLGFSWTAPSGSGIEGYYIYRTINGVSTLVGTSVSTSFTDTGLLGNTSYSYSIAAYGANGWIDGYVGSFTGSTNSQTDNEPGLNLFVPTP